ncbi:hypothetical protein GW15_0205170 [Xanthomonas axonopodis pv. vasculorum]|uniref:Uncharacterized protein n=1 Tax=Xanthomonas axonopodis pv. vasculorum TaxID=325777 RepID=A0A098Q1Y8_9XANT|nr:hypothetical protein GW15_0205170 [Xanthomonas axonopodis pv. vasculorum]
MQHDKAGRSSAMARVTRLLRDASATRIAAGSQGRAYDTATFQAHSGTGEHLDAACEEIDWQYRRMHRA